MTKNPDFRLNKFDRANAAIGAAVFIISFVVYNLTKAPTFSFWDCGEFVACAYILGIPHPPGSPLYVILGRIFSVLPIAADIAVRINLLSVVASAAGALFGYLATVRIIRFWFNDKDNFQKRIITYIGGFTAALFMAFSNTNWGNSVEAEVYAIAILIMMVILWLALRYFESKETAMGSRNMLLMVYLGLLGVGIHLTLYVVVPVFALYFIMKREAGAREWGIVAAFFVLELYMIFALSSRPNEIPLYIPILLPFIVYAFHLAIVQKITRFAFITMGLFLISLYPFFLEIVNAFSLNILRKDLSSTIDSLNKVPLGWIGLAGLTGWGLFSLFKYQQLRKESAGPEWLMLLVYSLIPAVLLIIGFIPKGYFSFLFLSVIIIAVLGVLLRNQINWLNLIAVGAVSMIVFGFWQFLYGLIFGGIAILFLGLYLKDKSWKTAISIIIVAVIGFSIHAFIPIRSAQNPSIDENKPSSSFGAFVGYLERKQYGSQSMVERMFVRRGTWEHQFGDYQRMGFWRFFGEQYGFKGPRFFIALILGLFGIWEAIRRKPDIGLPLIVLILLCSVGIVLYMNFADGTRMDQSKPHDYLEVRNRDYFFTPAFAFFGLAIGLGIAAVMEFIRESMKNLKPVLQKSAFTASCLLVLLPLSPLKANYFINDRSKNYMPYDYANNYLRTCDKDAILFTNGDNDTFPLWAIQEVYGVRKDVRVVNLSLAGTQWYIKQARDGMKVPIEWNDEQIDNLRSYWIKEGEAFRIQDQVVEHVITANKWRYPIYMTVTVPGESKKYKGRSLEENLSLEGMVHKLVQTKGKSQINFEKTKRLFLEDYDYRGLGESTVYKDENADRIAGNYATGYLMLADSLRRAGNYESAFDFVKRGLQILPDSYDIYAYGSQLLAAMGRIDTMNAYIQNASTEDKWKLYFNWGISAKVAGRMDDAVKVLELTHQLYPEYADAYRALVGLYYQNRYYGKLRQTVLKWVEDHPEDRESQQLLREIKNVAPSLDTLEGIE
jgi:tetratricopeptide (TPR) repeat protein